jgi:hypothetical protein
MSGSLDATAVLERLAAEAKRLAVSERD